MGRLRNKRGRKSNYRKKLQNDKDWENTRRAVKIRDEHKCKLCDSTLYLEIHHIAYSINGESILGKELEYLEWLVTVCEKCHVKIHTQKDHDLNPKNKNRIPITQFNIN